MIAYFTLVVAVVGLIIYALSSGKAMEIGRIMFWTGLLAFLLHMPDSLVKVIR